MVSKAFSVDVPSKGRVEILFEGIYMNGGARVNDNHLGSHYCSYTAFGYDLTLT